MKKIFLIIFLFFIAVLDKSYWYDYLKLNKSWLQCVNKHWVNKAVENKSNFDIFIPVKNNIEWWAFRNNLPNDTYIYDTSWSIWDWSSCDASPSWSSWSKRSKCSVSCGWWIQSRTRTCSWTSWNQSRDINCKLSDNRTVSDNCCINSKPWNSKFCSKSCSWNSIQIQTCNADPCWSCWKPINYSGNSYNTKVWLDWKCRTTSFMNHNPSVWYRACYGWKTSNCDLYGWLYNYKSAETLCGLLWKWWKIPTKGNIQNLIKLWASSYNKNKFSWIINSLPWYYDTYWGYRLKWTIAHFWTSTSTTYYNNVAVWVRKKSVKLYNDTNINSFYNSVICVKD